MVGASLGHTCVDDRLLRSASAAASTASSSHGALETRQRQASASAGFSPHAQPLAQQQRGPSLTSSVGQQQRALPLSSSIVQQQRTLPLSSPADQQRSSDMLPTLTSTRLKVVEAVVFEATTSSGPGIDDVLDSTGSSSLPGLVEARLRELGLLAAVMWLQAPSGMLFSDVDA